MCDALVNTHISNENAKAGKMLLLVSFIYTTSYPRQHILRKVHVYGGRNHTVIPRISPIAPIERCSPAHIINHTSKQTYPPPFWHRLAPRTRIYRFLIQFFSPILSWALVADKIEAVLPGFAWCMVGMAR